VPERVRRLIVHWDFCTLFDRNYLFKGLALHESLLAFAPDFTLHVLCMDDVVHQALSKMRLPSVQLIRLADFEDEDLLRAKSTRSHAEYCWTCTPSLPLYVLDRQPGIESVTYLDADLWFFSDPAPLHAEMHSASVGIIEHRYAPELEHLAGDYGIYNVEFMVFRNDERGRACLAWWRERCLEWCYSRVEDGKFGDQKYLDDWPERFAGVAVLETVGAGLAPWNLRRYSVTKARGTYLVDGQPLVFFHYHSFQIGAGGRRFRPSIPVYRVDRRHRDLLFRPYWSALKRAIRRTQRVLPGYSYGLDGPRIPSSAEVLARRARARLGRPLRSAGHEHQS
jgi:hypothetical protein